MDKDSWFSQLQSWLSLDSLFVQLVLTCVLFLITYWHRVPWPFMRKSTLQPPEVKGATRTTAPKPTGRPWNGRADPVGRPATSVDPVGRPAPSVPPWAKKQAQPQQTNGNVGDDDREISMSEDEDDEEELEVPQPSQEKAPVEIHVVSPEDELRNVEVQAVLQGTRERPVNGSHVATNLHTKLIGDGVYITCATYELMVELCVDAKDLMKASEFLMLMEARGHVPRYQVVDYVMELYYVVRPRQRKKAPTEGG